MTDEQTTPRWHIDLDWLEQHNRSFLLLAQCCLCPKCVEQTKKGKKPPSAAGLLSKIKECCSQTPGFITGKSPILESIFRIFVANGNEPLSLEELGNHLAQWRGDNYCASDRTLTHLLESDQYYGLKLVA